MGKKRVHQFSTWTDAELSWKIASKNAECSGIALRALVHGAVKWLPGEQPRMVGLCDLKEKHGGVVILSERELVKAVYLNDWLDDVQTEEAPPGREYMPQYKSWLDIRRLAAAAKSEQDAAQAKARSEAEGCCRGACAPEVDQNIRTY